ncbi:hypothetical protein VPH35_012698 [Triticum aestivum]
MQRRVSAPGGAARSTPSGIPCCRQDQIRNLHTALSLQPLGALDMDARRPAGTPLPATATPSSAPSSTALAPSLTAPALAAALAAAFLAGHKAGPAVRGRLVSCKLRSTTTAPASQSPPTAAPGHLAGASSGILPVPSGLLGSPASSPRSTAPTSSTHLPRSNLDRGHVPPPPVPRLRPVVPVTPPEMSAMLPCHNGGHIRPPAEPSSPCCLTSAVNAGQLNTCGREAEATGGWQLVKSHCGPRHPDLAAQAFKPSSIPSWLKGRCCRCLAPGHRAFVCRDPVRCARCLENGHRARGCCNKWRPLSSLASLVVPPPLPRPRLAVATVQDPAPRFGPGRGWPLPQLGQPQLLDYAGIGSMPRPDDFVVVPATTERQAESASIIVGQTELLHAELRDCIVRVGNVLASAEAAVAKLQVVPIVTPYPRSRLILSMGRQECMEIFPLVLHRARRHCMSCRLLLGVKPLSRSWLRCCRLCLSCRSSVRSPLRLFRWCYLRSQGRLEGPWRCQLRPHRSRWSPVSRSPLWTVKVWMLLLLSHLWLLGRRRLMWSVLWHLIPRR